MLLVILFCAVAAAVGGVSYFVGQQRIRDIATFAAAHGLVVIGDDWDLGDGGFWIFGAGDRRYWRNVIQGKWNGLQASYCDYAYVDVDPEHKGQRTYSFSVVVATLPVPVPQVTVSPRTAIEAFAEKSVGAPGIRFESIDFNDRFDVRADDNAFAVELIDAQMIETILGLDRADHVVFGPQYLMVYSHRRPVDEIGAMFDSAALIVQRIPALVLTRTVA